MTPNEKQLKSILIDLETGAIDKYAAYDLITTLFEVEPTPKDYEPYFGWCDVDGCENEGSSGGMAWRESGYWTVCMDHGSAFRNGKPQPKMKQSAIDRENSRDKKTGYLTYVNPNNTGLTEIISK